MVLVLCALFLLWVRYMRQGKVERTRNRWRRLAKRKISREPMLQADTHPIGKSSSGRIGEIDAENVVILFPAAEQKLPSFRDRKPVSSLGIVEDE